MLLELIIKVHYVDTYDDQKHTYFWLRSQLFHQHAVQFHEHRHK